MFLNAVLKPCCSRRLLHIAQKTLYQRALNIECQVEQLQTRGLLRVKGDEAISFLQGLVTNDMKHLQEERKCLFTMFLNTKGRVMYDSIIYKTQSENIFLLECDILGLQDLQKHLKMYCVRRKIDIDVVDDEWKIWVLFNPKEIENLSINESKSNANQEHVVPCTVLSHTNEGGQKFLNDLLLGNETLLYCDPRLPVLGTRVLAPAGEDIVGAVKKTGIKVQSTPHPTYRMCRYKLGVGEGITELPIGKCFPLESNCDYLHGVSFHKGCYIGQELTARTHHTGVVRKRLMPLLLETQENVDLPVDTPIEDADGRRTTAVGKLRGIEKDSALGLMRIVHALEVDKLKVGTVVANTVRPFWWPQEAPKDRIDSSRKG